MNKNDNNSNEKSAIIVANGDITDYAKVRKALMSLAWMMMPL